ncbi:hypothetical protein ABZY42_34290 [Streptomyces sp. NPDC006622]|uniref:hypothetical protein n=1 Tax=Streptomyces sp. NPDC006622 TaxID=3155459 RepID=UPI0033B42B2B
MPDYDLDLVVLMTRCQSFRRLVDLAATIANTFHDEIRQFDGCWGTPGKDQIANSLVPLAQTEQIAVGDGIRASAKVVLGLDEALRSQAKEIGRTQQDAEGAIQQQSGSSQNGSRH